MRMKLSHPWQTYPVVDMYFSLKKGPSHFKALLKVVLYNIHFANIESVCLYRDCSYIENLSYTERFSTETFN